MIISEEIDLGLELPEPFDPEPLFPEDRLLRLHPNWFISDFKREKTDFSTTIKDYATEETGILSGSFLFSSTGKEVSTGKELLTITLSQAVTVEIFFYNRDNRLSVQFRSPEKVEADNPLLLWVKAIREYLRIYVKKTPATLFFRLVMNRMVLQMNPSQRKISLMIARLTVLEILVIILIVVGYVIFVL